MSIESYDHLEIRCPPLGGSVTFKYCRVMNKKLPCKNIIHCWLPRMDIGKFLQKNYTEDELKKCFTIDTTTKLQKILQIIENVRKGDNI